MLRTVRQRQRQRQRQRLRSLVFATASIVPLCSFVVVELALLAGGYGQRSTVYFSRSPAESGLYAGKLIPLLAPWAGIGVPLVGRIESKYEALSLVIPGTGPVGTPILARQELNL